MKNLIVNYVYKFTSWDDFVGWLKLMGFERYEYSMPCRRGYLRNNIDIRVPYFSNEKNVIIKRNVDTIPKGNFLLDGDVLLEFDNPNEIPQELLKEFVK